MQNVLILPTTHKQTKEPLVSKIKKIISKIKKQQEQNYLKKRAVLKEKCYFHYLKKILNNEKVVDLPAFYYYKKWAINPKAIELAEKTMNYVENLYGRKHIEKCFKLLKKRS